MASRALGDYAIRAVAPVCDALAASGDAHGFEATRLGYAHLAGSAGSGHTHDEICSSVDSNAPVVPTIASLPLTSTGDLAALSDARLQICTILARRDPAPPLSYHARSLHRLV